MNILGIIGFFHDPSSALLVDGKLVAFVEEERLVRVKHENATLPECSIEYCLQAAGISFGDLDSIVCEHDFDVILSHDRRWSLIVKHSKTIQRFKFGIVKYSTVPRIDRSHWCILS